MPRMAQECRRWLRDTSENSSAMAQECRRWLRDTSENSSAMAQVDGSEIPQVDGSYHSRHARECDPWRDP
jgi:ferric-dicitrate binding protein FerR (iron transport regulator)